jgi:hypothetical protein
MEYIIELINRCEAPSARSAHLLAATEDRYLLILYEERVYVLINKYCPTLLSEMYIYARLKGV